MLKLLSSDQDFKIQSDKYLAYNIPDFMSSWRWKNVCSTDRCGYSCRIEKKQVEKISK